MNRTAPLMELLTSSDIEHVQQGVALALSFDDADLVIAALDGLADDAKQRWATHVLLGQTADWSPALRERADAIRLTTWHVAPKNAQLATLLGLRNVTEVHLSVSPPDLVRMFDFPKLERFRIDGLRVDAEILAAARVHPVVHTVFLNHVSLSSIAELAEARLALLTLSSPDLVDLSSLATARVEALNLFGPSASLSTLSTLPETRWLTIGALGDWDATPELPVLESLTITDSNQVPGLSRAPRLRRIHFAGCSFDSIDLTACVALERVEVRAMRGRGEIMARPHVRIEYV